MESANDLLESRRNKSSEKSKSPFPPARNKANLSTGAFDTDSNGVLVAWGVIRADASDKVPNGPRYGWVVFYVFVLNFIVECRADCDLEPCGSWGR